VPFHHQPDQAFALLIGFGEELLGCGQNRFLVRLHLDLRDRFDRHGDALLRVEVLLRRHVKRHQFEREVAAVLDHRKDDRAVPLHHARAAKAVNDQRFMRARLAVKTGQ
jgi:hypothetical protein